MSAGKRERDPLAMEAIYQLEALLHMQLRELENPKGRDRLDLSVRSLAVRGLDLIGVVVSNFGSDDIDSEDEAKQKQRLVYGPEVREA